MRKYTLYQASRLTKISRYKLVQAIEEGLLTSIEGKGNIKCFILENVLNEFVEKHGDEFRRLTFPSVHSNAIISEDFENYVLREIHNQVVSEKDRVINLLEFQNEQLKPMADQNKVEKERFEELRNIVISAISALPDSKADVRKSLQEKITQL
jgi:hypothetical protein